MVKNTAGLPAVETDPIIAAGGASGRWERLLIVAGLLGFLPLPLTLYGMVSGGDMTLVILYNVPIHIIGAVLLLVGLYLAVYLRVTGKIPIIGAIGVIAAGGTGLYLGFRSGVADMRQARSLVTWPVHPHETVLSFDLALLSVVLLGIVLLWFFISRHQSAYRASIHAFVLLLISTAGAGVLYAAPWLQLLRDIQQVTITFLVFLLVVLCLYISIVMEVVRRRTHVLGEARVLMYLSLVTLLAIGIAGDMMLLISRNTVVDMTDQSDRPVRGVSYLARTPDSLVYLSPGRKHRWPTVTVIEDNDFNKREFVYRGTSEQPRLSADGLTVPSVGAENDYFYLNNPDTGAKKVVLPGLGSIRRDEFYWSPDGTKLAVTGETSGKASLSIVEAETGKELLRQEGIDISSERGSSVRSVAWLRDGKSLLFTSANRRTLYRLTLSTRKIGKVTTLGASDKISEVAPTSDTMAFLIVADSDDRRVVSCDLDTGKTALYLAAVQDIADEVYFSADFAYVAYRGPESGSVIILNLKKKHSLMVLNTGGRVYRFKAWASSGRKFVIGSRDEAQKEFRRDYLSDAWHYVIDINGNTRELNNIGDSYGYISYSDR